MCGSKNMTEFTLKMSFWRTVILLFNLLLAYSSQKVSTHIKEKQGVIIWFCVTIKNEKNLMNELFLGLVVTLKPLINQNIPIVFQN